MYFFLFKSQKLYLTKKVTIDNSLHHLYRCGWKKWCLKSPEMVWYLRRILAPVWMFTWMLWYVCGWLALAFITAQHDTVCCSWLKTKAFNLADTPCCVSLVAGNWRERHDKITQALYMQILGPGVSGLTSVPLTTEGARRQAD